MFLRFFRFLKFWESAQRRAELREELKSTANLQRAIHETRRDYFLERDLARLKDDEAKGKPPKRN